MTLRYSPMNQHDALYMTARKYPGGLEALSQRMNMSVNVLRNKLRPSIGTHHVTNEEESLIMELCEEAKVEDALLPLHAKNWRHRMIAIALPTVDHLSDEDLTHSLCRAVKEFSDLAATTSMSLADGKVTAAELDQMEREAQEALAAVAELRDRMRARAAENGCMVQS
ncbi:phage regulatory CII family protein [Herbaspirillum sp. ST 5-3]|uniref:phage regulatory CII family protein n=1 Tax=Oxalobacteraceae TaxID=75682 RepID=UPI002000242D|nr:phage regulatory CII family protein [Herbaspirillum sp. ST 5-3]